MGNKRDNYTNLEIDVPEDIQKLVVDVILHEGELREQDNILAYMSDHQPPAEYAEGYRYAVDVLTEYIYGPNDEEKETNDTTH